MLSTEGLQALSNFNGEEQNFSFSRAEQQTTFDLATLAQDIDPSMIRELQGGTISGTTVSFSPRPINRITYLYVTDNSEHMLRVSISITCIGSSLKVAINEENFPDDNFRGWIEQKYDTDHDKYLSKQEIERISEWNYSLNVKSFQGIEFFYNLKKFESYMMDVKALDLSMNINLEDISIKKAKNLNNLVLPASNTLKDISIVSSKLPTLNIPSCPNLTEVTFDDYASDTCGSYMPCYVAGESHYLNVVGYCPKLKKIHCENFGLEGIDISKCPNLTSLHCPSEFLAELDVSHNSMLEELVCGRCFKTFVPNLIARNHPDTYYSNLYLKKLVLCKNNKLTKLACGGSDITSLDLSQTPNLETLDCSSSDITSLDLSQTPNLETLDCSSSHITSLKAFNMEKLKTIDCNDCRHLTQLEVNNCKNLEKLNCADTSCDVINTYQNPKLKVKGNHSIYLDKPDIDELTYQLPSHFDTRRIINKDGITIDGQTIKLVLPENKSDFKASFDRKTDDIGNIYSCNFYISDLQVWVKYLGNGAVSYGKWVNTPGDPHWELVPDYIISGTRCKDYAIQPNKFIPPSGKLFKAWLMDGEEKQPGDIIKNLTKHVTLTAVWTDVEAIIPKDSNHPTNPDYEIYVLVELKAKDNGTVTPNNTDNAT
ncbi:leucine-rich repeat domain-containing protein, partial [Fannyhessea vaginae]